MEGKWIQFFSHFLVWFWCSQQEVLFETGWIQGDCQVSALSRESTGTAEHFFRKFKKKFKERKKENVLFSGGTEWPACHMSETPTVPKKGQYFRVEEIWKKPTKQNGFNGVHVATVLW